MPHLAELPGKQASKYRVHVAGGIEVPCLAELLLPPRVVSGNPLLRRSIETQLHEARERDSPLAADNIPNLIA